MKPVESDVVSSPSIDFFLESLVERGRWKMLEEEGSLFMIKESMSSLFLM